MSNFKPGRSLDIGTSYIISAREYEKDNKVLFSEFRDAFVKLVPSSPIAKKMMAKGLKGQQYFEDTDGSYIVVGQDAIERAIERNISTSRPLVKGVISPSEKQARRILRHIFKEILGQPEIEGEKVVYSIPAQPIDQEAERFDVGYHTDVLNNDLASLGFTPKPLHEAEAICYSELEDSDYTGLAISAGAGMQNICLMSSGDAILHFSVTRSGDWVDRMAAAATGSEDTIVQVEKENSKFTVGTEIPNNPVLFAVAGYYVRLIQYVIKNTVAYIASSKALPRFTDPIPIVIAGGTSLANGYVEQFQKTIEQYADDLPFKVKEVRAAKNQLRSVARGLLIASTLE